jgi:NAD(P)-dependent dehydrogenase (short-subunit alcohol dehydrogenase family)
VGILQENALIYSIGKMIAAGYAANGAKVYITSRKNKDCEATAKELNCNFIATDISSSEGIGFLVKELTKLEGRLDILVNNAGCNWNEPIEVHSDKAFEKVLQLNLKSVYSLTRECLPLLRAAEGVKRVINIGSINGLFPPAFDTFGYSASKAGLHMLTKHMAATLAPDVTVNCIAPGSFESKMMAETLSRMGEYIKANVPMRRIGEPSDMASVCLWLSGPGGTYVNGSIIVVDGGVLVNDGGRTFSRL